jgi:hypothetical protein
MFNLNLSPRSNGLQVVALMSVFTLAFLFCQFAQIESTFLLYSVYILKHQQGLQLAFSEKNDRLTILGFIFVN